MKNFNLLKIILLVIFCLSLLTVFACSNTAETSSNASESVSKSQQEVTSTTQSTTSQTPTTSENKIVSASLIVANAKKSYVVGDKVTNQGISISVTYEDGTKRTLNNTFATVTASSDFSTSGEYDVTISFEDLATEVIKVMVYEKPEVVSNEVTFEISSQYSKVEKSGNIIKTDKIATVFDICTAANIADTVVKRINLKGETFTEKLTINASNVKLFGADDGLSKITYNDHAGTLNSNNQAIGTDGSSTIYVNGANFEARKVTFENSHDYFTLNSQAVAVTVKGDKAVFVDCVFLGQQDTLQIKDNRQYYKNCTIKGSTDFIFGNNPSALLENCNIVSVYSGKEAGYVTAFKGAGTKTAKYGVVFLNCNLTKENGSEVAQVIADGSISLGRPWRADATVAYISCNMDAHISKEAFVPGSDPANGTGSSRGTRYVHMSGGGVYNIPESANFVEYGNTGAGAVDTQINNDFTMLTKTQADEYTIANIFAKTNGGMTYSDDWNPTV